MALAKHQRPVKALHPHGLHPPLGVGVRLRRPDRRAQHLPSLATEHFVEGASELGVVVAEQEPDWDSPIAEVHRGIPRLLDDPRRAGVRRDPGRDDPPGAELDEEQHVQGLEPDRLHREEVAGHDPRGLGFEELRPARCAASRRRTEAVASQQRPDGGGTHPDAELAQLPADPNAAPPGILPR
jgi:hypothetical protein